jgi:hypothetical protein
MEIIKSKVHYECQTCKFITNNKAHIDRHNKSNKHIKKLNPNYEMTSQSTNLKNNDFNIENFNCLFNEKK